MLSTNIFYSGYNILFSILSLFIGIASVFLVKDSPKFRGLFLLQIGGLFLILITYLTANDHILYKFGLNYNLVTFVRVLIAVFASLLWINASSELYAHHKANREALAVYTTVCLSFCLYHSFFDYNAENAIAFSSALVFGSISLLFLTVTLMSIQNKTTGNLLLVLSVFMLWGKLLVSTYFFHYNQLNLNLFNWLWIYVFATAVFFMKIEQYKNELQKSYGTIDKLNLQISNMIDSSPFPIIISKLNGSKILLLNDKASDLLGVQKKDITYYKLNDFFVDEENRLSFFRILENDHEVQDFDIMVCTIINSAPFWLSVSAKAIEFNNEMALYMAFQNITLRKERENNLKNLADKDPLTQVWNRRYFEKLLPERIHDCIASSSYYSLLMLDADKFKNVNDTYGHKTGDKVLIRLAQICCNSLREDDIVCRYGGEEFIVFLNNTNTQSAVRVAERLRNNIAESSVEDDDGNKITFTVSIGVVSSEKNDSPEILLRQVDDAMYLAKHNGRNRVEVYDETAVKDILGNSKKKAKSDIHPVFSSEDTEEISLLDNYNKLL